MTLEPSIPFTLGDLFILTALCLCVIYVNRWGARMFQQGVKKGVDIALHNLTKTNLTIDVVATKNDTTIEFIVSRKDDDAKTE